MDHRKVTRHHCRLSCILLIVLLAGQARATDDPCLTGKFVDFRGPVIVEHLDIRSADGAQVWRALGLVDSETASAGLRGALSRGESTAAIVPSGQQPDKYGRTGVFLKSQDQGVSVQALLVKSGEARVHHDGLDGDCFTHLTRLEDEAILGRRGLWADPRSSLLSAARPETMASRLNSYQVVEGRILSTGRTSRVFYLNFGQYWREDFTVEIRRRAEAALLRAGKSPEDWVGRRVRVRGWLSESRGPMIALDSPHQIELISD